MSERIEQIPLTALVESPFNPRRTFGEAKLQELAESIKSQGVMQPIVVRPLPQQLDVWARYEIVFGHRRFRAAGLAGLEFIPAILREMDDAQAATAQLHENIEREDMTAMDEADGVARLVSQFGIKAHDVGPHLKKSRTWGYNMLQLSRDAAPRVREACLNEGLPGELALELAKLRNHKLQEQQLERLRTHEWREGKHVPSGWLSIRSGKQVLDGVGKALLDGKRFDPADVDLVPEAGACAGCPRRAGNDPGFADLNPDVCTDKECHDKKVAAHVVRRVAQLKAAGHAVLDGPAAEEEWPTGYGVPRNHTPVNSISLSSDGVQRTYFDAVAAMGDAAPPQVAIVNPRSGELVMCVRDADVQRVRNVLAQSLTRQAPIAPAAAPRPTLEEAIAGWTPAERLVVEGRGNAWGRVRLAVAEQLLRLPRTQEDLREIVRMEFRMGDDLGMVGEVLGLNAACARAEEEAEEAGREFDQHDWWISTINALPVDQLGAILTGLAVDNLLTDHVSPWDPMGHSEAKAQVALAERYGVDVVAASGLFSTAGEPSSQGEEGAEEGEAETHTTEGEEVSGLDDGAEETPAAPAEKVSDDGAAGAGLPAGDLVDRMLVDLPAGDEEVKDEAGASAGAAPRRASVPPVKYRCPATGKTWTGRGLRPKWVCEALESGTTLAELEVKGGEVTS